MTGRALNQSRTNGVLNGKGIEPGQDYHSRMTSNICPGSGLAFGTAADRDAMMPQISNTTLQHFTHALALHD